MARIGIDATYSVDENAYGISRYSRRLVESLLTLPSAHQFLICYRLSRFFRRKRFTPLAGTGAGRSYFQPPWGWQLPSRLDMFHSLAQRPAPFRFRREVVTVHDVFPLTGKDYSTPAFQRVFSELLMKAVGRAVRVITPSEYTASELVKYGNVPREKIRVVPEGVDPPLRTMTAEEKRRGRMALLGQEGKILLNVGALQTRKNLIRCLEALLRLPEDVFLVLAGGEGHGSQAVHATIHEHGLEGRVRLLGYVSEGRVEELYEMAEVLLFPSLEEGYGLPVLEAMAHSLPVVTSSSSALPEVGGDAALYVNPLEVEDITRKVSAALQDESLRKKLVERGLRRVKEFSWRRAAEATMQVYEEVLSESSS